MEIKKIHIFFLFFEQIHHLFSLYLARYHSRCISVTIRDKKKFNLLSFAIFQAAVARNLFPDENENVPPVLEFILKNSQGHHLAVRHTSVK